MQLEPQSAAWWPASALRFFSNEYGHPFPPPLRLPYLTLSLPAQTLSEGHYISEQPWIVQPSPSSTQHDQLLS
eukprot:scaffold156099_cov21-Tisochrysis_lutea.AAC.2